MFVTYLENYLQQNGVSNWIQGSVFKIWLNYNLKGKDVDLL